MHFTLSEERRILADTAARFVRERYPLETRHANARREEGFDPRSWAEFAELGLIGALLPAAAGGYGGLGEDIALVFETLGQGLVVEPFLASGVLAATPLFLAGSSSQKALLEDVIASRLLLALAHGEPESRYGISEVRTTAVQDKGIWRLNGQKAVVLNGDTAQHLVVSARVHGKASSEDGLGLFLVDANSEGLERRGYGTVEGGRAAEITFRQTPGEAVGQPGKAFPLLEATIGRGVLALAAEALGIMEVCKATTLDYLKTRQQFGRPLGAFQALQHRMVDVLLEIEQVRSAVMLAAGTLEADRVTRERNLSAAKNLVGRAGRLVAEESIQLHGGIAMTWEYSVAHYAKRLIMIDHLLGDSDHHLDRFLRLSALNHESA